MRQRWLWVALVIALAATTLFGIRSARRAAYWRQHADEPLRPWMTLGYVAHSYHLPPHVLTRALNLPLTVPEKRPLVVIARVQHRDVKDLMADLRRAIIQARPPNPPPAPP